MSIKQYQVNKKLSVETIVLVAQSGVSEFNPSQINSYFLVTNGILNVDEILPESIFSAQATRVISNWFHLVVVPNQLQISLINVDDKSIQIEKILKLIKILGSMQFIGLGINFTWRIDDPKRDYQVLSKAYFKNNDNPLIAEFDCDDAFYGNYMSKKIDEDVRLKLEMKPIHLLDTKTQEIIKTIHLSFNFHSDLKVVDQHSKVIELIQKYNKWVELSSMMLTKFN